jgi:3-oxoacyl-[acyl-carrier protein] reductase
VDLGIQGRVALVTASSKGLGRASAIALAKEGVSLVICARDEETLSKTAATLKELGAQVLALPGDVTDPSAPKKLVDAAIERYGRLDIIVANNGGPPPGRALEIDDDALHAALEANLMTSIRLARLGIEHMVPAGWGRICAITSVSVVQPIPNLALSNTARTGLWAWVKTAAMDLMGTGVTLNIACPGLHATDRVKSLGAPDRKLGDPADFGSVVAFMCSGPACYLNGAAVVVDGGETLAL